MAALPLIAAVVRAVQDVSDGPRSDLGRGLILAMNAAEALTLMRLVQPTECLGNLTRPTLTCGMITPFSVKGGRSRGIPKQCRLLNQR